MLDLVGWFGDHREDSARPQGSAVRSSGIGLVGAQRDWCRPWPAWPGPRDPKLGKELRQRRGIIGLTGSDRDDQWKAVAVDQRVGLGCQPATGSTDRMIVRFSGRILVVRLCPLCGSWARPETSQRSHRADEPSMRSSRPRPSSRSHRAHQPRPATQTGPCPRSRRSRTGGAASRPSATDRSPQEDHARQPRSDSDRSRPRPAVGDPAWADPSRPSPAATPPRSGPTSHRSAPLFGSSAQHQAGTPLNIGDTP